MIRVALLLALVLPCASDPGCEDAWGGFATSCYIFQSLPATWSDAQSFCQSLDSSLVAIESDEENVWLIGKLSVAKFDTFWAGAEADEDREWHWQPSNKPMKRFNNWAGGEPNNAESNENCLEVRANSEWNDLNCDARLQFVCEKARSSLKKRVGKPSLSQTKRP